MMRVNHRIAWPIFLKLKVDSNKPGNDIYRRMLAMAMK
jgi:hypothetical protein